MKRWVNPYFGPADSDENDTNPETENRIYKPKLNHERAKTGRNPVNPQVPGSSPGRGAGSTGFGL